MVIRRLLGVVAAVTPWNSPMITPAWKWLPALVAGNAVVLKPSELSTAIALATVELWREAGLPAGVLELVPGGAETGRMLCAEPSVDAIHFTGSTDTGRAVAGFAAARSARCVVELGGLYSAIVFDDADLEHAADCIVSAAIAVNGQKCTPARARRTRCRGGVAVGADDANRGAPARRVPLADPLRRRDLFAPVLTVESFDRDDGAWEIANETPYGLAAAVYTSSVERAGAAQERLEVGVVGINRRCDSAELEAPIEVQKLRATAFRKDANTPTAV